MKVDPEIQHSKSTRLTGYDYALPGAYFVTLVTQGHKCLFGEVVEGNMVVNLNGMIVEKALTDLFSGERRLLYQRRLEEMAYLLFKLGRREEAKISLSVAKDLEKPLNPIQPDPFLFQLVTKSIFSLLAEAYEKKTKEVSLIVKP